MIKINTLVFSWNGIITADDCFSGFGDKPDLFDRS